MAIPSGILCRAIPRATMDASDDVEVDDVSDEDNDDEASGLCSAGGDDGVCGDGNTIDEVIAG